MTIAKPTQVATPFANSGLKNTIPQSATGSNLASLEEGFPAVTMTAVSDGGTPPQGQDLNGILNQITNQLRYSQAGGLYPYDATFCTAIGGYPLGAILMSADGSKLWQNQVAGNTNNPDVDSTNWTCLTDTVTGNLYFPLGFINSDDGNNYFSLWAGTPWEGASIALGTQEAAYAGSVVISPAKTDGSRASITRFENSGEVTYTNNTYSRIPFSMLSAPEASYTALTLPASGNSITAPDDGYLSLLINSTASNQFVRLDRGGVYTSCFSSASNQNLAVNLRVGKGNTVTVRYTALGTTQWFRFSKTICASMRV